MANNFAQTRKQFQIQGYAFRLTSNNPYVLQKGKIILKIAYHDRPSLS